jgi:hypothetical protein
VTILPGMARQLRIQFLGALYHVINRSDRRHRKGHPKKVNLAAEMRAATTLPLAWIAQRLAMGNRGYLTWLLQWHAKSLQKI